MELFKLANQRNAVLASVGAWAMDSFDFFLLIFVLSFVAQYYNTDLTTISIAVTLTLVARPIGALVFGQLAEIYGRKPILVINVLLFVAFEFLTIFAPSVLIFIIVRFFYGATMGGIWGVASSLALESVDKKSQGFVSGLFQAGYPMGYLLAALCYALFFEALGWKGLFLIGVLPIFLAIFIVVKVKESPVWLARQQSNLQKAGGDIAKAVSPSLWGTITGHWKLFIYAVILMTFFNFLSHGTGDSYPIFLENQNHFSPHLVGLIAILYNISSIIGGIVFGSWSSKIGRQKTIIIATIGVILCVPLWAFSQTAVMLCIGAILIQFMVQGAWGVIPVYLSSIMPENVRSVLPGFVYQLGNFFAASNLTIQTSIAEENGGNYSIAMSSVTIIASIMIIILIFMSKKITSASSK